MIDHIGSFIYWAGSASAAYLVLAAVAELLFGHYDGRYFTVIIELALALVWLIGEVSWHVLAGT